MLADTIARTAFVPSEVPVGIITALGRWSVLRLSPRVEKGSAGVSSSDRRLESDGSLHDAAQSMPTKCKVIVISVTVQTQCRNARWVIRDVNLDVEARGNSRHRRPERIREDIAAETSGQARCASAGGHRVVRCQPLVGLAQEVARQAVAFVPQESAQMFPFTVAETVLMGRFPHRRWSRWNVGFGWDRSERIAPCRIRLWRHYGHWPSRRSRGHGSLRRRTSADRDRPRVGPNATRAVAR